MWVSVDQLCNSRAQMLYQDVLHRVHVRVYWESLLNQVRQAGWGVGAVGAVGRKGPVQTSNRGFGVISAPNDLKFGGSHVHGLAVNLLQNLAAFLPDSPT